MGGSKTTTQQSNKQKQTVTIPREIRERGTAITEGAMNHYFDPAERYQPFSYDQYAQTGRDRTGQLNQYHSAAGSGYAGLQGTASPYNQAATGIAGTFANQFQPGGATGGPSRIGSYPQNQNAATNTITGMPQFNQQNLARFQNPHTQGVINRGIRDIASAMNQNRLQNQSRAAQVGAFGGARHGVLDAENQANAMQTMSDFVGNQLNQGYQSAVNQFNQDYQQRLLANQQNFGQGMDTTRLMSDLGQRAFDQQSAAADSMLNFGNTLTAQDQATRDAAYAQYLDQRDYPMEVYERLAAMNAMQPHNRTSTTTGSTTGTQSQNNGWLGPALQAGGMLMMSDERAKEDVQDRNPEDVLSAFAQIKPKTYAYKSEVMELGAPKGERRGFMAQDLEKAFARKSGPDVGGYKTVDVHNVIGDLMAAVHGLEKRTRKLKGA